MQRNSHASKATWIPVIGAVLCALVLGVVLRLGAREHVQRLLEWLNSIGFWGPVLFVLIEVVVVLLLLPGIPFTLGAGFLFGPLWGTVCVVAGHALGGTAAFLLARFFLGRRARAFLKRRQTLHDMDEHITQHGWQTIMLTRMVPFFPFKLSNYLFGLMRFSLRDFVIGTSIGIIPISATNVYAGSLAAELATMPSVSQRGPMTWVLYGTGLIALVVLVILLGRTARHRLRVASVKSSMKE